MNEKFNSKTKKLFSFARLKFLFLGVMILSLLVLTQASSQDLFVNSGYGVTDDYKSTLPKITVNDKGKDGVVIKYRFKGVVMSPIDVEGTRYYMPHIYGLSHLENIGAPRLPVRNLNIALPAAVKPVITIIDAEYQDFTKKKYKIHPAMAPHPDCYNCPEPTFSLNSSIYEKDAMFPKKPLKVISVDTYRGVPIATVQVRPMQYNPVTGEFRFYSKLKFKVTFNGAQRSFNRFGKYSQVSNRMVRRAVLNSASVPRGVDTTGLRASGRNDYIIITHSDYLAAANDIAMWKRQLGYSVEVVSQSSWTAAQIDTALKDRYNSWDPKPLYFLIIGDENTAPPEYSGARYTDLYFAEMDGSGFKPEMAYGRIFASSTAEAQLIVDKIINYEKNPPTLSSFYTNATTAAMYQDTDNYDSYADRRFCHTSEDMRNYLMGQGYTVNRIYATGSASVDPIYYNNGHYSPAGMEIPTELQRPNFDWLDDYTDINNSIDAGRFLLTHRDHGGVTLWGDPEYTTTHIGQLNNGELLPVVFSINCLTGKYVDSTECFAEKFLCHPSGGCVGIFAATEVSYSGYNDGYACGAIDAIWPDPGIDPQFGSGGAGNPIPAHGAIVTMGDVLNQAKMAMTYLWADHQTTWELHHYYGDPAMRIWTAQPTAATAAHASTLDAGSTSLDITSSNCPGGTATLVYEGILYGKTTLAGDGTGTITFSPLSGVEPTSILTVSKHNYIPYIADIPVSGGLPPDADFTADKTNIMASDSIQFTDMSTMSPTSWDWTFAGGTPGTSTEQNPLITYNVPGVYTVSLTATNINGSNTETKTGYITVTTLLPPVANFAADDTNVEEGSSITFTDQSINLPTSWSWSFPGGTPSTSTEQNPTITYNTPGTYTVTLTAANAAGSDDETKADYITVTIVLPTVGHTSIFSTTSISQNRRAMPFTMPEDGTIQSVTIYHEGGSGGLILGVYDGSSLPQNRLGVTAATPLNAAAGWQTIDLVSPVFVSSGSPVWLAWVFENNPGIRYEIGTPGRAQSDALWAGGMPDPFGTSTISDFYYSIYASYMPSGGQPPVADFTADNTTITEGGTVNFTDQSTNTPTSWSWTFAGGTPGTSTAQNPGVTYNTPGTYTVTLIATNSYGSDTETKVDYITVNPGQPPVADFTADNTTITEGGTVNFTDLSTNNPDAWDWTFAGGTPATSTAQNPGVTYNTAGTYTVTLIATNSYGSDTETKVDYITVNPPQTDEIYVYDITQVITKKGVNYESAATVTIRDTSGAPVSGATVYITWSGVVGGSASEVTAADGTVSFKSDKVKSTGPFTITVTNVTHATLPYNPALNNKTSDTAYY